MKKIDLYKRVRLNKDFSYSDGFGKKHFYKSGEQGLTIDFCNDQDYVIVELDNDNYDDSLPALPIDILEYIA